MPAARVIEIARAKINLALHVLGRRHDGYHEIDSIVAFAELGDRLTFESASRTTLDIMGPFTGELTAGPDNLVLRAAAYLADVMPGISKARIVLEKNLPIAAGLGGGSADAAATLRGLARLSHVTLPSTWDRSLAHALGADVPVCLLSRASRMTGIGEELRPVASHSSEPVLLVNPGSPVATADVFKVLGLLVGDRAFAPIANPADLAQARNDLTVAACSLNPAIGRVLAELAEAEGARLVRMSGSGATCFGLFASPVQVRNAADAIAARHPSWWYAATTLS